MGARSLPWPSSTVPLPPAWPLLRDVVPRGGGGGRAAWHALRCDVLHLFTTVGGAWRSRALGAAARVTAERVRRRSHGRVRLRVGCGRRYPHLCVHGRCGPPESGVKPPSQMSWRTDGWGGQLPRLRGPWPVGESSGAVGLHPPPSVFAIRGPSLAYQATGQSPGESLPAHLAPGAITRGFRRHLRLRLCGGLGCSGAAFLGRYRQCPRAVCRARGSQTLASVSVTRSTAPPSRKAS